MKKITVTGESVEKALEKAMNEYGIKEDEYEYKVVEKGFKGFLGLFSKEAKVEISLKPSYYERIIKEFVEKLLSLSGIKAEVTTGSRQRTFFVKIDTQDAGKLIGKHGKTLAALQHIITIYANRLSDVKINVVLDAGDYRDRRRKQLESITRDAIKKALETKGRVELDPMFPFERRIVHEIVKKHRKVKSYSVGVEPYRRVVVEYVKSSSKTRR